jgi:hypothetical protein
MDKQLDSGRDTAGSDVRVNHTPDSRQSWEKPVLLPLDVGHAEGNFSDYVDEDDFKSTTS